MTLSELIKYHRKKSNLTQSELATLAGVGKTVIFDIEHGKETIQLKTLQKVLKTLNITLHLKSKLITNEIIE